MKKVLISLVFAGFLISGCGNREKDVVIIPVEKLFKKSDKSWFMVSPSGTFYSFVKSLNGKSNLYISPSEKDSSYIVTDSNSTNIQYYFWANNHQVVYLQNNDNTQSTKIFSVDIKSRVVKDITPFDNVKIAVIDLLGKDENRVLITMNKRLPNVPDLFYLDINSGKAELAFSNPGKFTQWKTDNEGALRLAAGEVESIKRTWYYRYSPTAQFAPMIEVDFRDTFEPIYFDKENKFIYAASNIGRDKCAIVKYDPELKKEIEILFQDPEMDVYDLLRNESSFELFSAYYKKAKLEYHFFDSKAQKLYENLKKRFDGMEILVLSYNDAGTKYILKIYSDTNPGGLYLYDINNEKTTEIYKFNPDVNPENMSSMKPISFIARDGLKIHGYLTLPVSKEAKNLPTVIYVHGGPWARDYFRFDSEVQFYANRGYAVLQVNYRGSTDYGKQFMAAGFKEWGGKIQNDIEDGTRWLIKQGIADSAKIAISGYSFGGYSALYGATFKGDLYKCAAAMSGLSNIRSLLTSIPYYSQDGIKQMVYTMVGDPVKDSTMLKNISPFNFTEKVKIPLMIGHGTKSEKVNTDEMNEYVKMLLKKGVKVEYVLKDNEGHIFRDEQNIIEWYNKLDKFLASNLTQKEKKQINY
ncbi:MAG: S9 family peptidase [Melioribacteraceae bacterium]|nr:S9 family peptidase [Melioribacteraceae bacterium]